MLWHDPDANRRHAIKKAEEAYDKNCGEVGRFMVEPVTSKFSKKALMGAIILIGKHEANTGGGMAFHVVCPDCLERRNEEG